MKWTLFATLEEFLITKIKRIPIAIADKLYQFHIYPMDIVRKELGIWITASLSSGYRPKWYELSKRRSGNSQHTFEVDWKLGSGAVDWTCENFAENKDRFLKSIMKHTQYTRICMYETFLHCDYKDTPNGERQLFEYAFDKDDEKWKWFFINNF